MTGCLEGNTNSTERPTFSLFWRCAGHGSVSRALDSDGGLPGFGPNGASSNPAIAPPRACKDLPETACLIDYGAIDT